MEDLWKEDLTQMYNNRLELLLMVACILQSLKTDYCLHFQVFKHIHKVIAFFLEDFGAALRKLVILIMI